MSGENLNNLKNVNRQFYKKLTIVGIPMVIQQVIAVTLNLADTIMVGKVGENALAAVGAANQIYFIFGVVLLVSSAVRRCMRCSTGESVMWQACEKL